MMQVWLVLMAMFFWRTGEKAVSDLLSGVTFLLAWGTVAVSIVLVFVNGGTTG